MTRAGACLVENECREPGRAPLSPGGVSSGLAGGRPTEPSPASTESAAEREAFVCTMLDELRAQCASHGIERDVVLAALMTRFVDWSLQKYGGRTEPLIVSLGAVLHELCKGPAVSRLRGAANG